MAEGWAKSLKPTQFESHSAGTTSHGLNPSAVKVMREVGVDITSHHSKTVEEVQDINFDYVITVCASAHETCPVFFGPGKVVHRGFDDPPTLAKSAKSEEEALEHYRRVRDEIRAFVETLPEVLTDGE